MVAAQSKAGPGKSDAELADLMSSLTGKTIQELLQKAESVESMHTQATKAQQSLSRHKERVKTFQTPKIKDNIDTSMIKTKDTPRSEDGAQDLKINEQLYQSEFYGLPFKKMKPTSSEQVHVKLDQLHTVDYFQLEKFYLENRDFYDRRAYLRTLDLAAKKIRVVDPEKAAKSTVLKQLLDDCEEYFEINASELGE